MSKLRMNSVQDAEPSITKRVHDARGVGRTDGSNPSTEASVDKFTNETGAAIEIRAGISQDGTRVNFSICGPQSLQDSLITRVEAEHLLAALQQLVGEKAKCRDQ